jgi:flagellar protein FlaG
MSDITTSTTAVKRAVRKYPSEGHGEDGQKPESTDAFAYEDMRMLAEEVNDIMKGMRNEIRFKILRDSNELIAQVVNNATDEVIRTIPPESLLNMRAKFDEVLGLIFDEER